VRSYFVCANWDNRGDVRKEVLLKEDVVEALKEAHRDMDFFSSFIPDDILRSHLIPAQKRIEDAINKDFAGPTSAGSAQ